MKALWKKSIALFTVLCLLVLLFPLQAFAATPEKITLSVDGKKITGYSAQTKDIPNLTGEATTPDGLIYEIYGDEVAIIGYDGPGGDVTIPDTIEGKPVTSIDYYAFSYYNGNDNDIDTLTIGATITYIADGAFEGREIDEFVVNSGNTEFSSDADGVLFNKAQTVLIQYPIGNNDNNYAVPEGVTEIRAYAFSQCNELNTVTLPSTLQIIGMGAFNGCGNLQTITIPINVSSIEESALSGCYNLQAINVDAANATYSSVDGVLFNKAQTTLLLYPKYKTGATYSIPGTVTTLVKGSFSNCQFLVTLNIPASVTSIQEATIVYCYTLKAINVNSANPKYYSKDGVLFNKSKTHLILYPSEKSSTSYTVPGTVKYIDMYAFAITRNLTKIKLPSSLTSIGPIAFSNSALTSISIPTNVKTLGFAAFAGSAIKSVTINSKLASISEYAFNGCENLTSVTLPKNIKKIEYGAFAYCTRLKTAVIPYTVLSIEENSFDACTKLTIKGYKYSYAQSFAKNHVPKIKFSSIGTTPMSKITATSSKASYGTVSGAAKYYYGKTCELTATPKAGYKFVKWMEGNKKVSTDAVYTFTVTKARSLKAVFAIQ